MAAPVSYRDLCKACLWLGLTAYGGPAMVGYVREVVVERRRWVGAKEFADGLALCQLIPGATLTQVISYVGLLLRGPAGAAAAAACFIFPGALLVLVLSALYFRWQALPIVQTLSHGVAAVVVAILAYACLRLAGTILPTLPSLAIAVAACLAYLRRVNAFVVILGAAAVGFLTSWAILVMAAPRFRTWSQGGTAQGLIRGVVASFVGMLLSLLVRFGTVALTDLPSVLLSAGAFAALLLGVDLPFVIAAGLLLSVLLSLT